MTFADRLALSRTAYTIGADGKREPAQMTAPERASYELGVWHRRIAPPKTDRELARAVHVQAISDGQAARWERWRAARAG